MASKEDISKLPPLPRPNRKRQRQEAIGGCSLVLFQIVIYIVIIHFAASSSRFPKKLGRAVIVAIYSEAFIALCSLIGLFWGDPGVVKRTPQTCFPLPPEVEERLAAGQPLSDLKNIEDDDGVRSFCVRCLVWRELSATPTGLDRCWTDWQGETVLRTHHCRICERCVTRFDHHCGVFGRCIAGTGFSGNMSYFMALIFMAFCAPVTCLITGVSSASYGWDAFELESSDIIIPIAALFGSVSLFIVIFFSLRSLSSSSSSSSSVASKYYTTPYPEMVGVGDDAKPSS